MTHFLRDILRQPEELRRTIGYLSGEGRAALEAATAAIRGARHVYLTGMGSSWHAALNVGAMFHQHAQPVYLQDAMELLQFATLPADTVIVVISRSGRSIEIVQLLAKARESGATIIGLTNSANGPLAGEATISIVVPVEMDHAISVNTYSTLALAAGMLASSVVAKQEKADSSASGCGGPQPEGRNDNLGVFDALTRAIAETARAIPGWQAQLTGTAWLAPHSTTYFLARGSSLGNAYEARLMWEEGVKSPATAMGTGSFRHGPQEIVAPREGARPPETANPETANKAMRFGMWIDGARMREQDLAVARDLRQLGAQVMLIGQKLPEDAGDLVFQLPAIPPEWQFLIDIIPAQLTAERLSRLSGVDCDSFRLSSYIVEDEYGLLPKEARRGKDITGTR